MAAAVVAVAIAGCRGPGEPTAACAEYQRVAMELAKEETRSKRAMSTRYSIYMEQTELTVDGKTLQRPDNCVND